MKKLIVSLKSPHQALEDFKKAYKKAQSGTASEPHYEIAFDNKRDFEKFIKNIDIIMSIQNLRPKSIYELSKILNKDQSNLNKIICFFESYGVIKIQEKKINNRSIKTPIVEYKKIEFNLNAA